MQNYRDIHKLYRTGQTQQQTAELQHLTFTKYKAGAHATSNQRCKELGGKNAKIGREDGKNMQY